MQLDVHAAVIGLADHGLLGLAQATALVCAALETSDQFLRGREFIQGYHLELGAPSHNLYHIAEFAERMERNGNTVIPLRSSLPHYCYSALPTTGELIRIGRGTDGCSPSDHCNPDETGREAADRLNQRLGITKAQEAAMLSGSMFGWAVPSADPKNYDNQGTMIQSMHKPCNAAR